APLRIGMTGGVSTVERLRQFIRELSPEARAMLLNAMERGALSDNKLPGLDLILEELRDLQRGSAAAARRCDSPDRRFFQPLAPFLVYEESVEKIAGRINRSSLAHVWRWLERDLLPVEIASFATGVAAALEAGDEARADHLTREIQDRAVAEIARTLLDNTADRKSRQKLVSQLGGEGVLDALSEIVAV